MSCVNYVAFGLNWVELVLVIVGILLSVLAFCGMVRYLNHTIPRTPTFLDIDTKYRNSMYQYETKTTWETKK